MPPIRYQRLAPLAGLIMTLLALFLVTAAAVPPTFAQTNLVTGSVTDPAGSLPPAGTQVYLFGAGDDDPYGQSMVTNGQFSIGPVPNGNYWLVAIPPTESAFTHSLPQSIMMTGAAIDVGVVALTYPTVTGTVFAPDGVTPIPAAVRVYLFGEEISAAVAPDGQFKLGGIYTGTYRIQAEPLGDVPLWKSARETIEISPTVVQTFDLTLTPANVVGRIVDPNGAPIHGARIHVWGIGGDIYRVDTTSASGHFAIGALPDHSYILHVEPPWHSGGFVSPPLTFFNVPPAVHDLGNIALRDAPKIVTGFVKTNDEVPVANAKIVANRIDYPGYQETLTGSNGMYTLHLSGGLWSLTVEPTDASDPSNWVYPFPPQFVHFDADLQPEYKTLHFGVIRADSIVSGIVAMPDGGVPGFPVHVGLHTDEGIGREVLVDPASGQFTVRVPHGPYILKVEPEDPSYAGPPPQLIQAPQDGLLNVGTLHLIERDATIAGHVVDESGAGVGGVLVVGWTRFHQGAQTWTNPDGSYVLAVTPGEWLVGVYVPPTLPYVYFGGPLTATVESEDDLSGFDFALTSADNTINGILVDENGERVITGGWALAGLGGETVNGGPIAAGQFALPVPDGVYDVSVHFAPGSDWLAGPPENVTVSGGENVTVTVPLLPQNADIVGALWDPRAEVVVTGVNAWVAAYNNWTAVFDDVNPVNGTYHLGVGAGLWGVGYIVDPESGYVATQHHKIVALEANQTVINPLPVVARDSILLGVVLNPDGAPLPGALVAADGVGGILADVTLRTHTDSQGHFRLAVPHGAWRLRAGYASDEDWLNPVTQVIHAPRDQAVDGLRLRFRLPDGTLTGTTSLANGQSIDGDVVVWGYSADGAANWTTTTLGDVYAMGVLTNTRWHIGAALETEENFYAIRTNIFVTQTTTTLDLALHGPYAKPAPVIVTFDPQQPQHILVADGTQIFIPAGAMPTEGPVTLHITPIATFPNQHHARLYKYGYAFIATDATGTAISASFNQNVIISFMYDEAELAELGLREDRLRPAYYSTTTQSWTLPVSYVVDMDENRVVLQIDHFTDYTLVNIDATDIFMPMMVR